eukprot:2931760-Heterocapsa_arctica.AAC.1
MDVRMRWCLARSPPNMHASQKTSKPSGRRSMMAWIHQSRERSGFSIAQWMFAMMHKRMHSSVKRMRALA